ncbi:type II toxin-antitoxin system death-on-curing family toxin [Nitratireductor rhodophyticola]|uniref:Type II toxin-antitoxin system death-on-curing family toxin n=1 Tax=Nitratireductor rhodophyticola TaxID=2854036 RepID=A0ABS7RF12_9HYPH|nr:type II toxin-antitoxin system death-on-curing family toxin [Nitratireductor rhodophyticola]MBY8918110.1 type II toxin-antitoxin system death-on-curing family toxin [Nitratireductor rhodophyticola]MBY8921081.1 type II toxin-antitoxin system death-on-curing family toxin [Nitratireductor rhodophyticola]MEC9246856.1 type II toxin-antitoxin system death-on-curing family toxin [Pseudomonadota bacterium]WPZ14184.1 type II toxin-antitoxin system death-on-curing family toxin [Nitratireductor rhodoph
MTEFHSRDFVEALHVEQLRLHGGASGVRDEGALESALHRPLQKQAYEEPDLCALAAAYLFGIVKNHPFVDGNKRTGLAAADLFLFFNGLSMEAEQEDVIQLVLLVAAGEIDEEGAARFFRDHTVPFEA